MKIHAEIGYGFQEYVKKLPNGKFRRARQDEWIGNEVFDKEANEMRLKLRKNFFYSDEATNDECQRCKSLLPHNTKEGEIYCKRCKKNEAREQHKEVA